MSRRRLQPDLDLTPLIDVLFMLVLFFVLTASLLQGQISVSLPAGQGTILRGRPAVIEILSDGHIRWEGRSTSREDAFILARQADKAGRDIVIAADRNVPYGTVASFLETLRTRGVQDVGLALGGGKAP